MYVQTQNLMRFYWKSVLLVYQLNEVNMLIIMTSSNSTSAVTTETASQSKAQQICRKVGNNARSG